MSCRSKAVAFAVLALAALWLFLCLCTPCAPSQLGALVLRAEHPLIDWNFVRLPADFADCYARTDLPELFAGTGPIRSADVCNPPLVYALSRLLPATFGGGLVATGIGVALYLAAAAFFLRRRGRRATALSVASVAVSLPFVFAVQVGNVIFYAAAAALVFLALYDAESRRGRAIAALCLALAFAVKISPVMLGVLYFGRGFRRNLPFAALAAVLGAALLLVPFAWYGGTEGLSAWVSCAAGNSAKYEYRNVIGLYGVFLELGRIAGRIFEWHEAAGRIVHALSALIAVAALCVAAFDARKGTLVRIFLAVAGMLMLPPTMMIYTLLYAMPVILIMDGALAAVAFVALANPLQIFVGEGTLQPLLAASLFLALVFRCLRRREKTEGAVSR